MLLIFTFIQSIARSMKSAGKGKGGGGAVDLFGEKKSKRFKQTVNVKFKDVMGMQKSKE